MKTRVITETKKFSEPDYNQVILVIARDGCIVLTNGEHNGSVFSGTSLTMGHFVGRYSETWSKESFAIITEPFIIEFNSK